MEDATDIIGSLDEAGQPAAPPDDVAIAALEASMATIRPEIRTGRFGPEVAVADDADPTDRLVAFLGRTP
jgi:hypothetical protein